jgi:hypothetical protein
MRPHQCRQAMVVPVLVAARLAWLLWVKVLAHSD